MDTFCSSQNFAFFIDSFFSRFRSSWKKNRPLARTRPAFTGLVADCHVIAWRCCNAVGPSRLFCLFSASLQKSPSDYCDLHCFNFEFGPAIYASTPPGSPALACVATLGHLHLWFHYFANWQRQYGVAKRCD